LIITRKRPNETWEVEDGGGHYERENHPSCPGPSETSELEQLFLAISNANSSIMRLSIAIRNSPIQDEHSEAASRYHFETKHDIDHVKQICGSAKGSTDWLIERLWKVVTRHRQYLRYRQDQHEKIYGDRDSRSIKTEPRGG
jgi:hypothetical protein